MVCLKKISWQDASLVKELSTLFISFCQRSAPTLSFQRLHLHVQVVNLMNEIAHDLCFCNQLLTFCIQ
jgi:hypothetical protein